MKLYFNGCSHTYGDDLKNKSHAWPYIVSKNYNSECFNDSVSGGTNDRILYNTLNYINDYDKFYIAWTYVSRFTRYRSDNNYEINFNCNFIHGMYGKKIEFLDYAKLHYRHWYNELYEFKIWLQKIIFLQNTFKQLEKSYQMIFLVDNKIKEYISNRQTFQKQVKFLESFEITSDDTFDQHFSDIQNYVNLIDYTKLIDWNTNYIKVNELKKVFPVGNTKHLLDAGHQHIAEYVLKHDSN
jgi:hypothetical protein